MIVCAACGELACDCQRGAEKRYVLCGNCLAELLLASKRLSKAIDGPAWHAVVSDAAQRKRDR